MNKPPLFRNIFRHTLALQIAAGILFSSFSASSQTLQDTLWNLIKERKFAEADTMATLALQRDSGNVDALMMKGNIMLNSYLDSADTASFYIPFYESVFDTSASESPVPIRIIPARLAIAVDSIWKKCLRINNRRVDIHQGLCYVYSLALMKNELLAHLPVLKEVVGDEPGLMFSMGEYAQLFGERGRFDEAMEIYRSIETWYPEQAGLLSDIGLMYYHKGKMKEAKSYFIRSMDAPHPDEIVYSNARLFFTAEGSYDRALKAAIMLAGIDKSHEGLLYRGIYEYYLDDKNWRASLEAFLKLNEGQRDRNTLKLARALLSKSNRHDFKSYLEIDTMEMQEIYTFMLHKRAMDRFTQEYAPVMNYGTITGFYYSYSESAKAFGLAESRKIIIPAGMQEDHILFHAWALQQSGMKIEAAIQWKKLLYSSDFFRKSAAAYFYGSYMLGIGYVKDAEATFSLVSAQAERSKFATYCARLLEGLKK
jgi:tetratricopeptide (TPR) repeat protein